MLVRVTAEIVLFVLKPKENPRSHTNQRQPKHSCLELDPTFKAKQAGLAVSVNPSHQAHGSFFPTLKPPHDSTPDESPRNLREPL